MVGRSGGEEWVIGGDWTGFLMVIGGRLGVIGGDWRHSVRGGHGFDVGKLRNVAGAEC